MLLHLLGSIERPEESAEIKALVERMTSKGWLVDNNSIRKPDTQWVTQWVGKRKTGVELKAAA